MQRRAMSARVAVIALYALRICMNHILVTGFEPFGGYDTNISHDIVSALSAESDRSMAVSTIVLPVDIKQAPRLLAARLRRLRPTWCLMLGQDATRASISVERVALNVCDFNCPDNAGNMYVDQRVVDNGPAAYFSTISDRSLLSAVKETRVQANLSLTAGSFVCNALFYSALHTCAVNGFATRCGFLHLPIAEVMPVAHSLAAIRSVLGSLTSSIRELPHQRDELLERAVAS